MSQREGDWKFYPQYVNDRPASILFDKDAWDCVGTFGMVVLYALFLPMHEPGEHGIGTEIEDARFQHVENAIVAELTQIGLRYVARLRNNDAWQLTFYGPSAPGFKEAFEALATQYHNGAWTRVKHDPTARYFREFIWPSRERWRWIGDLSVVTALGQAGDINTVSRNIDHTLYFADPADARVFSARVKPLGFEVDVHEPDAETGVSHVSAKRSDPVTLDHIHEVTWLLEECAEEHSGEYDGWGSFVVKAHIPDDSTS